MDMGMKEKQDRDEWVARGVVWVGGIRDLSGC